MAGCFGNNTFDKNIENELFDYLDNQEEYYECNVCGVEIEKEGICDSKACIKADNE